MRIRFFPILATSMAVAFTWSLRAAQTPDTIGADFSGTDSSQANFTGTWRLNVEKSHWSHGARPGDVVIMIETRGDQIKYRGTVIYSSEDVRIFEFDGAFDGKPYRMSRSYGDGYIRLHRVDAYTFEATSLTDNGRYSETTRTTISRDGKSLTRKVSVQSVDGNQSWTEVYNKQ